MSGVPSRKELRALRNDEKEGRKNSRRFSARHLDKFLKDRKISQLRFWGISINSNLKNINVYYENEKYLCAHISIKNYGI